MSLWAVRVSDAVLSAMQECEEPSSAAGNAAIESHTAADYEAVTTKQQAAAQDHPATSAHLTSDSGSRKTAFVAVRPGMQSAPDSQQTGAAAAPRIEVPLPGSNVNMASSARMLPNAAGEVAQQPAEHGSGHPATL